MKTETLLEKAPLGKKSTYVNTYTPELLFPLPRKPKRDEIEIRGDLPFRGFDLWTGFELSWLNPKGKPVVALSEVTFPCESPFLAESKSQKLYLNSFNNSKFESFEAVRALIEKDLSQACQAPVSVRLYPLDQAPQRMGSLQGRAPSELYTPTPQARQQRSQKRCTPTS
jgi:7-cyano-7-deazaguanine reductase